MSRPESRPDKAPTENMSSGPGGKDGLDSWLVREYGQRYIDVQRQVLKELPTEDDRLDWVKRYGAAFHDLAAGDESFHDMVLSEDADIPEIKRRVEEFGDRLSGQAGPDAK